MIIYSYADNTVRTLSSLSSSLFKRRYKLLDLKWTVGLF